MLLNALRQPQSLEASTAAALQRETALAAQRTQLVTSRWRSAVMKAALDKGARNAAKERFLAVVHLATAQSNATTMKAAFDKSVCDAAEERAAAAVHLASAQNNAATMKAAYDKSVCDAAEERAAAAADMAAVRTQAKANYDVVAGQLEKVGRVNRTAVAFAACVVLKS
jgi:hypothetical protein